MLSKHPKIPTDTDSYRYVITTYRDSLWIKVSPRCHPIEQTFEQHNYSVTAKNNNSKPITRASTKHCSVNKANNSLVPILITRPPNIHKLLNKHMPRRNRHNKPNRHRRTMLNMTMPNKQPNRHTNKTNITRFHNKPLPKTNPIKTCIFLCVCAHIYIGKWWRWCSVRRCLGVVLAQPLPSLGQGWGMMIHTNLRLHVYKVVATCDNLHLDRQNVAHNRQTQTLFQSFPFYAKEKPLRGMVLSRRGFSGVPRSVWGRCKGWLGG